MSNFTVSARKYRPGTFDSVVGQSHITQTLKNAIKKNHLGHALLFCGPRGVGKTTCARILAKSLNCESLTPEGEPCGVCAACVSFQNQQSFNIYELDAASNNSVDDIRSLNEQVRYAPQNGRYKIYIIDEVHMLSQAAFNAFLKTLEEPPSYAVFILATTEKHKIIPTILSRCQVYDFHRIGVKEALAHLKSICIQENIEAEDEALYVIAQKADGALRDALSIFDRVVSFSGNKISYQDVIENLNVLDYEYYFKMTDYFLNKDLSSALLLFNDILDKGFDGHNFLTGMSEHFRNLLVCKDPITLKLIELSEGTQQRYQEQSSKSDMSFLLSGLNILNQFDVNFKSSKNQRLHIELALMKLCFLKDVLKLPSDSEIEKKKDSSKPITPKQETLEAPAVEKAMASATSSIASLAPTSTSSKKKISFNLDKIKENIKASVAPVEVNESKEVYLADEKIDSATFNKIWKGYEEDLLSRKKTNLANALNTCRPTFQEDGSIIVDVPNDGLRNMLKEDKMAFIEFLNKSFKLQSLNLEYVCAEIPEDDEGKYIFSDVERFRKMAELNPMLKELQQRLGLRI